jgi:hypothetical protein
MLRTVSHYDTQCNSSGALRAAAAAFSATVELSVVVLSAPAYGLLAPLPPS